MVRAERSIGDYDAMIEPIRKRRMELSGWQIGDPKRAAQAMLSCLVGRSAGASFARQRCGAAGGGKNKVAAGRLRCLEERFAFHRCRVKDWVLFVVPALVPGIHVFPQLEHVVFYRNRDSQGARFLIQTPCWRTEASMDDATLFGRPS
jgi:hypothetical protein